MYYAKKTDIVSAFKIPPIDGSHDGRDDVVPLWIFDGVRKGFIVQHQDLRDPHVIVYEAPLTKGKRANPGDWVTYQNGKLDVCSPADFDLIYQQVAP